MTRIQNAGADQKFPEIMIKIQNTAAEQNFQRSWL